MFTLRQDGTAPVPGEGADCGIDWPAERELDFDAEGRRLPNLAVIDDPDVTVQQTSREGLASMERTYLTDPPTEYRRPAETAAYGDLGETEATKERRRKKANSDGKGGLRRFLPWL